MQRTVECARGDDWLRGDMVERCRLECSLQPFPLWAEPPSTTGLPKQSTAIGAKADVVVVDTDQIPRMKSAEGALELRRGRIVALDRIQQADDRLQGAATPWNPQPRPSRQEHPRVDGILVTGTP